MKKIKYEETHSLFILFVVSFYFSSSELMLLICGTRSSYAYHSNQCSQLNRCKSGIYKVTQEKAIEMGKFSCKICY